ncbi:MAG: DUF456 domain-containing protein [Syntrophales bacterium]|nr:DUF456 domain-containing protein [Syntrophales bacterium]
MPSLEALGLTIFILILFVGVYSIIFGFPGTIIILFDAFLFASFTGFRIVELKHIVIIALLAIALEIADSLIGLSNLKKPRISLFGVAASIIGSILGAVVLTKVFYGLGTLIGIFAGGFMGLLVAQQIEQKSLKPAFREATTATIVRNAVVLVKGTAAIGMTAFMLSRLYS